uniref:25S rRNA (uridine-N(3))-methyltransferase BMT5-like domain-containing protein n=1 Tax=Arundo donax TaxID=35708 RepID=A0A0A9EZF1_ARUDO
MGTLLLHGVNAKTMKLHIDLKMRRFDRIVFNFPHSGFRGREDQPHMINSHRQLVKDFFRNAKHLLRPNGQVHVSHKTKDPYRTWNLEELASEFSLLLIDQVDFHIQDHPGYNNKKGDGLNCDHPFLLGKCSTFKFRVGDTQKMKRVCKLGQMSYSGNSRANPNDQPIGFGASHSTPPISEMTHPYVPFDMSSVPVCSEFFVHGTVQRCLAEAGCIPQKGNYTTGTIPWQQSAYSGRSRQEAGQPPSVDNDSEAWQKLWHGLGPAFGVAVQLQ